MKDKIKIERLKSKIENLKNQINTIISNCQHDNKYKIVDGEYRLWECPDCGHTWLDKQDECQHENVVKIPKGDGGSYYDPPSYWYECFCPDCAKRWSEPQ
jgi:hypothetical protein